MVKSKVFYVFLVVASLFIQTALAQITAYSDSWENHGYSMKSADYERTVINYSISEFSLSEVEIDGQVMYFVSVPGVFLPGEEGMPDLPLDSRYIAVPSGAEVRINILSQRIQQLSNVLIAPAPEIPAGTHDGPLVYSKNTSIYETNAFFPAEPVMVSEITQIRGVDVAIVTIMPFRYNPVSQELIVHRDLEIEIIFEGGSQVVGDERLRSRWWDPVINTQVLNSEIIPAMDYTQLNLDGGRSIGYEYVIITPDLPDFLAWADSIRQFRIKEGIKTTVVTTAELGGNTVNNIKNFVDNAYNTWDIPPVAVLLLGDYSTGTGGVISKLYPHLISTYSDFPSDNYFADVTGNNLPDIIFARITANNAAQLEVMVSKFLNYERNPPTKVDFYNKPITAAGWQTARWFQICSEAFSGFLKNVKGKNPTRINAIYSDNPDVDPWSTAANTATIVNYFGPNGLGYIPATPQELGGFSGGTSTDIINAINAGSMFILHRNHGSSGSWGRPSFTLTSTYYLNNVNNELPYVFSINCQTGAYHRTGECLAERFHRHVYNGQNSGALGVLAASEVSYSFLNDVYLWGVMNNLFPDFMPAQSTTFPSTFVLPGFAAAAGKYFLQQSSWAGSSTTKTITYRLFHHHGDAFMKLYTEVPQALTISHPASISGTQTTMQVTANSGSFIALTANGEILGTATGTGGPLTFSFPPQSSGGQITVTVTKQNFFRYSAQVAVGAGGPVADFTGNPTTLIAGNQVTFTDLSTHNPTSWSWSFPGGSPATSNQKNPVVSYSTAGKYNVTLTASNSTGSTTITKTNYITVSSGVPVANFSASPTIISETASVAFTDLSTMDPVSWSWSFPGGSPSSSTAKNPVISYHTAGIYSVTLTATNSYGSNTLTKTGYITVNATSTPASANFTANITNLQTGGTVSYTDLSSGTVNSWSWSFPGGTPSSSNQQHPSVTYNTAGSYDVSLTVSNNLGSNTMTKAAYISVAPQAPVADFTASATNLIEGGQVNFTDLSINNPATWSWTFAGGTPATSTARHPAVAYYAGGSYNVTLTVSNASGSHTETRTGYITVTQAPTITYCESMGMSNSLEWIAGVNIGTFTNNSGAAGYSDFTNQVISLNPGTTYSIRLTPGFSGSPQREFWRVWIDYNGNGNFGDSGETVLVANNQRGEVTGQVSIPSNVSGTARMRVTMKGGSSPSSCEIFSGGEVEDYTIDFGGTDFLPGITESEILVYPNPFNQFLNIVTDNKTAEVFMYGMDGKLLRNVIVKDHHMLDLGNLRKGMYMLRLVSDEHIQVKKIIKR